MEIDENRHGGYPVPCEAARYDTIQFGTIRLIPTKFFRFNPHDTLCTKFDIADKIKVLIQRLRNHFKEEICADAPPVASIEFLYYGEVYFTYFEFTNFFDRIPNIRNSSNMLLHQ